MKTIKDVLQLTSDFLNKKGFAHSKREAEFLIADALGLKRMDLFLRYDQPLVEQELEKCRSYLKRRAMGEPLAYIHGQIEFADCSFKVTPDVLIPRQETEILVDMINQSNPTGILWDVCCGSGCIGISLKKKLPPLEVFISDINPKAIEIAKENSTMNQVEIHILLGDLLAPFQGKKAHTIVCNPPYVSEEEYASLDPEVKNFEPRLALVGGQDGLDYYRRLSQELPAYLYPGGKVWLEIGYQQGHALKSLFNADCWKKSELLLDWSGKNRFFFLEIE